MNRKTLLIVTSSVLASSVLGCLLVFALVFFSFVREAEQENSKTDTKTKKAIWEVQFADPFVATPLFSGGHIFVKNSIRTTLRSRSLHAREQSHGKSMIYQLIFWPAMLPSVIMPSIS